VALPPPHARCLSAYEAPTDRRESLSSSDVLI
jgi:hypothetical protein